MKPYRLASRYLAVGLAVAVTTVALTGTAIYLIYHQALDELAQTSLQTSQAAQHTRLQHHAADMADSLAEKIRPPLLAGDLPGRGNAVERRPTYFRRASDHAAGAARQPAADQRGQKPYARRG